MTTGTYGFAAGLDYRLSPQTVYGAPIPHNSALTSAGAELLLTSHWSIKAKFDGEFSGGSRTYGGTGTLRYVW